MIFALTATDVPNATNCIQCDSCMGPIASIDGSYDSLATDSSQIEVAFYLSQLVQPLRKPCWTTSFLGFSNGVCRCD